MDYNYNSGVEEHSFLRITPTFRRQKIWTIDPIALPLPSWQSLTVVWRSVFLRGQRRLFDHPDGLAPQLPDFFPVAFLLANQHQEQAYPEPDWQFERVQSFFCLLERLGITIFWHVNE